MGDKFQITFLLQLQQPLAQEQGRTAFVDEVCHDGGLDGWMGGMSAGRLKNFTSGTPTICILGKA
jgi:hypothetical protein